MNAQNIPRSKLAYNYLVDVAALCIANTTMGNAAVSWIHALDVIQICQIMSELIFLGSLSGRRRMCQGPSWNCSHIRFLWAALLRLLPIRRWAMLDCGCGE